ncbi:hypothetical protein QE152_g10705 [Popillia japonica]|uniref:Uncharacterized protein n=1 Tax=Popillia japonica TaxID=7064 RepID=A0AAW1LTS8_POPJA
MLEEVFERKSVFSRLNMKKKLLMLKYDSNKKLQDHFMEYDKLINSIESSGPKMELCDKVCHLLLSMPEEYDNVITALETMNNEKELTVEFIKARLLDAELKLKNKDIKLEKTEMDFSAQRTQKCFKCGKPGHKAYRNVLNVENQVIRHISVNKFGETIQEGEVLIEEEVTVEADLETIAGK